MAGAWTRKEGQNPQGGLNARGRAAAAKEGHHLKAPVSAKEAAHSPAAAQRRENFRTRMCGMKEKLTSPKTAHDPNSRINLALKKWDVKC